jgi:hypothetical protein
MNSLQTPSFSVREAFSCLKVPLILGVTRLGRSQWPEHNPRLSARFGRITPSEICNDALKGFIGTSRHRNRSIDLKAQVLGLLFANRSSLADFVATKLH